jgi:5-methylthioribose kinase
MEPDFPFGFDQGQVAANFVMPEIRRAGAAMAKELAL